MTVRGTAETAAAQDPGAALAPLAAALARIARAISTTLELRAVFADVAEAAATVVPFDVMTMGVVTAPDEFTVYAIAGETPDLQHSYRTEDQSPAIRVRAGEVVRVEDTERQLDPSYSFDRMLLEHGARSGFRTALVRGDQVTGAVSFWSRRPVAFTIEHEVIVRSIAVLLGLALDHERIFDLDSERRGRLDAIDSLLPAMAGSLEVREIFNRVSEVVKPVLPHDRLVLTSLSDDRKEVTVDAISGERVPDTPDRVPAPETCLAQAPPAYALIHDLNEETDDPPGRLVGCRMRGIRSVLKIPFRLESGGLGSLTFASRAPHQYSEEDVPVARR